MTSDISIRAEGVGKRYRLGQVETYRTLRESISTLLRGNANRRSQNQNELWALQDISFTIHKGEAVGIIGRNGAGKSTLLKVLSRITEPTRGVIDLTGRVGSLLEVGTGFHPELTGRENIFLNGAILGMRRTEIRRQFDEIVAFAGVEKFLDTPVKRYSSGMYTRLAFAVAAHLETEILIVDEVLAVGDAAFQKKCLGKMSDVATHGRTVLFVSHNLQAIAALAKRSIVLSRGRCIADGPTMDVIKEYLQEGEEIASAYSAPSSPTQPVITGIKLKTTEVNNVQFNGKPLDIEFEITTPVGIKGACLAVHAVDSLQQSIMHLWTFDSELPMCREPGVYRVTCRIPKLRLYMGQYSLTVYFAEPPGGRLFQKIEGACPFEVVMYDQPREFQWQPGACTYIEEANWAVETIR